MAKKRLLKLLLGLIAFQILNMSIDIPTAQQQTAAEKDYNYIDTYAEYVAEVVLKIENAVPESKHHHQRQFQLHKHLQIICQQLQVPKTVVPSSNLATCYADYSNSFVLQYIREINPPPPKEAVAFSA